MACSLNQSQRDRLLELLANSSQLEPITDPGREVVSWATCEWKPPHLREVTA